MAPVLLAYVLGNAALAQTTTPPAAAAPGTAAAAAHSGTPGRSAYVPSRVYDSRKKKWIDFETLVQRANTMDIVFVGEQHNDTPGHAMELALLEGIARRRAASGAPVVLSLEMFERDVQPVLNEYLGGVRDEVAFLSSARPWGNYLTDYRPLVELAKMQKWPVIAANIPRPLAALVSRGGLRALDTLNATVRREQVAADLSCPHDRYFKLFSEVMSAGHGGAPGGTAANRDSAAAAAAATAQRFYESQCVKDETMGEAVSRAWSDARARDRNALVVHMNGAFHTDYKLGTAERALRRARGAKHMVVSIVPTADLDNINAKAERRKADYLVFTLGQPE